MLSVFPEQHINRDSWTQCTKHSLYEDVVACSHFCNHRCGRRIDCWQKGWQRQVGVLTAKTTCAAEFAPFCVNMRDGVDLCLCVTEIPQHPWFLTIHAFFDFSFDHLWTCKDTLLCPLQVTQPLRTEQQSQLLAGFDEKAYLAGKQLKPGDDPYRDHAFNLQESDRLGSERAIRDTRHYRWAGLTPQQRCGLCAWSAQADRRLILLELHVDLE